jgi:pimeloyl-ACP methyl ester carboxylesterase
MITSVLAKEVPGLNLPVYFFHGLYDYTCSYTEAKSYFEQLKAPLKWIFTFKHSAHSPIFEELEKRRGYFWWMYWQGRIAWLT